MKWKAKFALTVLCVVTGAALCLGLAGCSGEDDAQNQQAASEQSGSQTEADGSQDAAQSGQDTAQGTDASGSAATDTSASQGTASASDYTTGTHYAQVTVQGFDPFVIELDADAAPLTVSNFCNLVNSGFYNGLTFHRVVAAFCLQGGDPSKDGTGGSTNTVTGEFSENGVDNALANSFGRGTVAMARKASDMNSASSQFFITLSDAYADALNGQYAAFGTIDSDGMATVDAIVESCSDYADPSTGTISDTTKQPVITSIVLSD